MSEKKEVVLEKETIAPVKKVGDTLFMSATAFLIMLKIERPTRSQVKEVRTVLTEELGKDRKTGGLRGWDIPLKD